MLLQPPNLQVYDRTPAHSNAEVYWHHVCHTVTINVSTSLLQDIPTFDGQDTRKLEDWLSNVEMEADILKESHAHLAEAKLCSLTYSLVCEALEAGKCWDDIRDILHLKLCNVNIHTYTSYFMEIQKRDTEILAEYVHCFKTEAKKCYFNSDTAAIPIFV